MSLSFSGCHISSLTKYGAHVSKFWRLFTPRVSGRPGSDETNQVCIHWAFLGPQLDGIDLRADDAGVNPVLVGDQTLHRTAVKIADPTFDRTGSGITPVVVAAQILMPFHGSVEIIFEHADQTIDGRLGAL